GAAEPYWQARQPIFVLDGATRGLSFFAFKKTDAAVAPFTSNCSARRAGRHTYPRVPPKPLHLAQLGVGHEDHASSALREPDRGAYFLAISAKAREAQVLGAAQILETAH